MNLVVGLTLKIFIIMAIGFGAKKFGIIDEQCKDKMSSLLVNLLLPVSMLASSQQAFNMENLKGLGLTIRAAKFWRKSLRVRNKIGRAHV